MLASLLRRGEGTRVAILPEVDETKLAETLVAFANTDGGVLFVGVDQDGRSTGQVGPDEMESALRIALSRCRPPVPTSWESSETPEGPIVAIRVQKSIDRHSLDDGRLLIRQGIENVPLTGEMAGQLHAKPGGAFEEQEMAGASREEDWDSDIVEEYLQKREERGASRTTGLKQLFFEIGATTHDDIPTVAGMLLFGRRPQAFLPQCGLVFVKFVGTDMRAENGLAGYGRREEIAGPLARMVERAWNVVWEEMGVSAYVKGLEREENPTYPQFAVREALVNAICHRDYRLSGRRVEVRMFSDRLEVISPGGLPGYITLDNIVDEHFSRNPRLVSGLYHWGYIEELGLGIDRMIEEMVDSGQPPPLFQATPYSFSVTLNATKIRPPTRQWERRMNDRQTMAIAYIRENGSITNREYQTLCPTVTAETLRLDMSDLVEKGILLKIGAKRGTYYILK
ncbi:MAG: putative DNA binding domain-containing protein [Anaerolineales bacterium]|nr:putative DNA binding domain-containing protein [Anaerolineales bacterium]